MKLDFFTLGVCRSTYHFFLSLLVLGFQPKFMKASMFASFEYTYTGVSLCMNTRPSVRLGTYRRRVFVLIRARAQVIHSAYSETRIYNCIDCTVDYICLCSHQSHLGAYFRCVCVKMFKLEQRMISCTIYVVCCVVTVHLAGQKSLRNVLWSANYQTD